MPNLKKWLSSLLLLATATVPALAGSNDANPANANGANATSAEATAAPASPSLTPTAGDANVTALLGVLVMKGVLAPTEANAIRNAATEAKFQLLVDALNRKGVLSAGICLRPRVPQRNLLQRRLRPLRLKLRRRFQ